MGSRGLSYVDTDGVTMEWDATKDAYFPRIDESALQAQQTAYVTWYARIAPNNGHIYYINNVSGESTWTPPPAGSRVNTDATWQTIKPTAPGGREYYHNRVTQQSVWERPAAIDSTLQQRQVQQQQYTGEEKKHKVRRQPPSSSAAVASASAKQVQGGGSGSRDSGGTSQNHRVSDRVDAEPIVDKALSNPDIEEEAAIISAPKDNKKKTRFVYASGLPLDVTLEELSTFFSRCGIILETDEGEERIRIYRNDDGEAKGDARIGYLRQESVALAIQILDGTEIRPGFSVSVERAVFTAKSAVGSGGGGGGSTSLAAMSTRRKAEEDVGIIGGKQKRKKKKSSQADKMLGWHELGTLKKKTLGVVVVKHLFTTAQIDADVTEIDQLKEELGRECSLFGPIKKIIIYDRHPDGIATVHFVDEASIGPCIATLNGRFFDGRRLLAEQWDGTRYNVKETDQEREARESRWEAHLNVGED